MKKSAVLMTNLGTLKTPLSAGDLIEVCVGGVWFKAVAEATEGRRVCCGWFFVRLIEKSSRPIGRRLLRNIGKVGWNWRKVVA
jgi:hypothetical protein